MQLILTLLRYLTFILALVGVFGIYWVSHTIKSTQSEIPLAPPQPPPARPYDFMIAANGIIESFEENVTISAPMAGLVTEVPVKVGQQVKKGEVLFVIDQRDIDAQLLSAEAEVLQAKAAVEVASAQRSSAQSMFERFDKVDDKRAIIEQEWQSSKDELRVREAQVLSAQAQVHAAEAAKRSLEIMRSRHVVTAPRDGAVLQLHARAGEWASTDPKNPSMIFGRTDRLQARVDIDEQNAMRIREGQKAVAHIKGDRDKPIELKLEYIEPYVIPKASLTGASTERVDTRVLQVIFSFPPPKDFRIYIGQQIDVFIEE